MYLAGEPGIEVCYTCTEGGDGGIGDVEECCCANGLAGKIVVCLSWVCPRCWVNFK